METLKYIFVLSVLGVMVTHILPEHLSNTLTPKIQHVEIKPISDRFEVDETLFVVDKIKLQQNILKNTG